MIEIIPAIDIIEGKCVRLNRGEFSSVKEYQVDPVYMASKYEELGFNRLHLVDLDGARAGKIVNQKTLKEIAASTNLIVDFGGGLKSDTDVEMAFDSGAGLLNIGSIAVANKDLVIKWLQRYNPNSFILGADVRDKMIAYNAWQETTEINVFDFIREYAGYGMQIVSCTDINKDGLLQGPTVTLYSEIAAAFQNLYLIASGGISSIADIQQLEKAGADAVIIGKALYEYPDFINELVDKYL
jgi:phosphoribosylformimino-5-aminoimidazole carboxamide ribotide isomerase